MARNISKLIKNFEQDEVVKGYWSDSSVFEIVPLHENGCSCLLSWLLNSREPHGLGAQFADELLKQAAEKGKITLYAGKTGEKVQIKYKKGLLDKALILTEQFMEKQGKNTKKGRFDIVLIQEDLCVVIENKYGSKEHDAQLDKYCSYLLDKRRNSDMKFLFVYLDPNTEPYRLSSEKWVRLDYNWIVDFIKNKKREANRKCVGILEAFAKDIAAQDDFWDKIDELCVRHSELLEIVKNCRVQEISFKDYVFGKGSCEHQLFEFYNEYKFILDELLKRLKVINNIRICQEFVSQNKNVKYYVNNSGFIACSLKKLAAEADTRGEYWFLYIGIAKKNNEYEMKLTVDFEVLTDSLKLKQYIQKMYHPKALDKRFYTVEKGSFSSKELSSAFQDFFSKLKKLYRQVEGK